MKTLAILAALLAPLAANADPFICQLNAVGTTLTECQAKVTGKRIQVRQIIVSSTTTTGGSFSLQYGTGTNCGTGTAALYPSTGVTHKFGYPPSNAAVSIHNFIFPLMVPVDNALCVLGVATNTAQIFIAGDIS